MMFLNLAIHEMPHYGLKPNDISGAKSLSEGPVEANISSGDC